MALFLRADNIELLKKYCKFGKFSRGLYFRETSHMQSFVKKKNSRNGKLTLSFIDIGKSCLSREFSYHISFNAIRENKILAKTSESTVSIVSCILPNTNPFNIHRIYF